MLFVLCYCKQNMEATMARPKSVDKNERPIITQEQEGALQIELDRKISALLLRLLKAEGLSKAAFGRKIDFSQANLNNVFSTSIKCEQNHWSFPLLIGAAAYFRVSVGELIMAAETYADAPDSDAARLFIACRGTKPHSKERLQRLIWEATGYKPEDIRASDRKLLELSDGVNVMEIGNPDFCKKYYSGAMTDLEVLDTFDQAWAKANSPEKLEEGKPPYPLWAALQLHLGRD